MPTTETRLIGTAGGMTPFDVPVDWSRHNVGITPSFFIRTEPKLDEDGKPVIDATGKPAEHHLECVRIQIVGDCFTEAVQPVDDVIKERFSEAYARWKANDLTINGTRLEDWTEANLSERTIRDMADLNIRSVEDLANLADVHVSRIIDGRSLRRRAQEWLEAHPRAEEASEIASLKAQNDELVKRLEALEKINTKSLKL